MIVLILSVEMVKKKYIKPAEKRLVASEPLALYQHTPHGVAAVNLSTEEIEIIKCSKEVIARGEYSTQEEADRQVSQWLS